MQRTLGSEHDRALLIIDADLERLRVLSLTVNYRSQEERERFLASLLTVRDRYMAAEKILTGKTVEKKELIKLNKYLPTPTIPKQMAGWINKLRKNIFNYLAQNGNNPKKQLDFIQAQYPLLDIVIKVLNGDAFFVGVEHNN